METTEGRMRRDEADETVELGPGVRAVRVGYVADGVGPALVVADGDPTDEGEEGAVTDAGLLRVSDAVVTLEIPLPGGGRSVLSWDPSEVALDPLVA